MRRAALKAQSCDGRRAWGGGGRSLGGAQPGRGGLRPRGLWGELHSGAGRLPEGPRPLLPPAAWGWGLPALGADRGRGLMARLGVRVARGQSSLPDPTR